MKTFELMPNRTRKSFYGKARVTENKGRAVLKSYNTNVAMVDENGKFHRLWSGYSATTMRHVNAFLYKYGIDGGGKTWWNAQPVERFNWIDFYVGALA